MPSILPQADEITSAPNTLLRRVDAARYVRNQYGFPCSQQWLARLAVIGSGPAFRRAGRFPIYDRSDLDDWAKARMSRRVHSTAELHSSATEEMA